MSRASVHKWAQVKTSRKGTSKIHDPVVASTYLIVSRRSGPSVGRGRNRGCQRARTTSRSPPRIESRKSRLPSPPRNRCGWEPQTNQQDAAPTPAKKRLGARTCIQDFPSTLRTFLTFYYNIVCSHSNLPNLKTPCAPGTETIPDSEAAVDEPRQTGHHRKITAVEKLRVLWTLRERELVPV